LKFQHAIACVTSKLFGPLVFRPKFPLRLLQGSGIKPLPFAPPETTFSRFANAKIRQNRKTNNTLTKKTLFLTAIPQKHLWRSLLRAPYTTL
jgi:hypothetical protein